MGRYTQQTWLRGNRLALLAATVAAGAVGISVGRLAWRRLRAADLRGEEGELERRYRQAPALVARSP
jgi:hypothetical protein